ncbi:MAG TPA: hypothetical protein DCY07_08450 [Rhodospirillaceae bacterium]|nr:hypothetical protein [Rhodospirillaceae bacterium]
MGIGFFGLWISSQRTAAPPTTEQMVRGKQKEAIDYLSKSDPADQQLAYLTAISRCAIDRCPEMNDVALTVLLRHVGLTSFKNLPSDDIGDAKSVNDSFKCMQQVLLGKGARFMLKNVPREWRDVSLLGPWVKYVVTVEGKFGREAGRDFSLDIAGSHLPTRSVMQTEALKKAHQFDPSCTWM